MCSKFDCVRPLSTYSSCIFSLSIYVRGSPSLNRNCRTVLEQVLYFLCYLIKKYRNLIRLIILRNISGKCCFHLVTSQSLPLVLDCHFERRFVVNQNTQVLHQKCRLFTYKVMLSCFQTWINLESREWTAIKKLFHLPRALTKFAARF